MSDAPGLRYVIIANPAAGRGRAARMAAEIRRRLDDAGADCEIVHTSGRGDAESLAGGALKQSNVADAQRVCVVSCGGDGTVQEAANALMRTGHGGVLGLAPVGRCNDFASAFGIDTDPDEITRILLRGRLQRVDLGRVNDRYFCTIAAFGFDAAVSRYVNDMKIPLTGTVAYVYGVLCVLRRYRAANARLSFDHETRDGPVFMAASANTRSYGGHMQVAPDARPDDGMLDVCVVSPLSRRRVIRLLRRVMRGRHTELPEVQFVRTRSVRIETDVPHEIWADGELVGQTPATIEAVAACLDVVVP